jgi:hypothetical protein
MKLLLKIVMILFLLVAIPSLCCASDLKIDSLCQFHYPSDYFYDWKCVQLTWQDTPRTIFGKYWQDGLRFNRMDRRHFVGGLWIKVPRRIADIKDFSAVPEFFPEAQQDPQFILIDQDEMFLGAYEYGRLVFSTPVAVGIEGYRLQSGLYRVEGADLRHESNLYHMEGTDRPYPMHYALRIYTEKREDGWSTYWLHGRDIPGYPASHGCIGLYDEEMQKEYYREPARPVLMDARKLYEWVVRGSREPGAVQYLRSRPRVLILGAPPEGIPEQIRPDVSVVPVSAKPSRVPGALKPPSSRPKPAP